MFRRINNAAPELIEVSFDDKRVEVPAGISVAAAMLYLNAGAIRQTPVKYFPRAAYCMMGICFDGLMKIDGKVNQRSCQFQAYAGLQINRQMKICDAGKPS